MLYEVYVGDTYQYLDEEFWMKLYANAEPTGRTETSAMHNVIAMTFATTLFFDLSFPPQDVFSEQELATKLTSFQRVI